MTNGLAWRGLALALWCVAATGCTTTARELRQQEPRLTREAPGTPAGIVQCTQDYLEEHFGGLWGRLGGIGYETRPDGPARHLIGRNVLNPSDALFALAVTPLTADRAGLRLYMDAPWRQWQESAVMEAVDACAPPAP